MIRILPKRGLVDPYLPRANEHAAIELRRDRRLVLLDVPRDLVRLLLPALLGDRLDALEFERVRVDAFLQAVDLVDGEPVVSGEEVAHRDVQVTLTLAVREHTREKLAARQDRQTDGHGDGTGEERVQQKCLLIGRTFRPSSVSCINTLV